MTKTKLLNLSSKEISQAFLLIASSKLKERIPKHLEGLTQEEWELIEILLENLELGRLQSTIQ